MHMWVWFAYEFWAEHDEPPIPVMRDQRKGLWGDPPSMR